jgi:single-strand DNA-binding protein
MAVNTPFRDRNGEAKRETCFVNVVVWGKTAEVCNQYLQKGRAVLVEGRLQSRSWQNSEGKTRNTLEVRARRVQFISGGPRPPVGPEIDLGEEPPPDLNLESQDLGGPL